MNVMYHGSPIGGLKNIEDVETNIFFLTGDKNVAIQYCNGVLGTGKLRKKQVDNHAKTIYTIEVSQLNSIDFREQKIRDLYVELSKKENAKNKLKPHDPDDDDFSIYPPLFDVEGEKEDGSYFYHDGLLTRLRLPSWGQRHKIEKLFKEYDVQYDSIFFDEGSQGVSLAVYRNGFDKLKIVNTEIMKENKMNLLQRLIKETLLLEAKENAEFLIKLNYDFLKERHPELHPKELHKIAKGEGKDLPMLYNSYLIKTINIFTRPNGYPREIIKLYADDCQARQSWPRQDELDYVTDWYFGDENAKNQINNLGFWDAHIAAQRWHRSLKEKTFDVDIADEGRTKTVYKFGNGSKIVELSWQDCEAEGNSMGHCVGTLHAGLVKDGTERIFSLRSETNKPHVTISIDAKTNKVLEIKGRENKVPIEKHAKLVKEWLKTTNFDYTRCDDYNNILSQNEKKEMLQTSKEKDIYNFFDLIFDKLIYDVNLSRQDFTKIALGAAMSCVHLMQEVKRTTELLSVVRDWTNGKVNDEEINKVYNELWELYRKSNYSSPTAESAARAAGSAARGWREGGTARAAGSALRAGISKQDIINSIEKEIGMPFEKFLFKNEEQKTNESLIRKLITLLQ